MQQVALLVFRMHTIWKYIYKSFCNLTVIKKIPQLEMFAPDWFYLFIAFTNVVENFTQCHAHVLKTNFYLLDTYFTITSSW